MMSCWSIETGQLEEFPMDAAKYYKPGLHLSRNRLLNIS